MSEDRFIIATLRELLARPEFFVSVVLFFC